jgi:hypothetical protein
MPFDQFISRFAQHLCKRLKIGFFSLTLLGDLRKVAAVQQGIWLGRYSRLNTELR